MHQRRAFLRALATLPCVGLGAACSVAPLRPPGTAIANVARFDFTLRDGSATLGYAMTKGDAEQARERVIFFVGGSNCNSYRYVLPSFFRAFRGAATIYALQKRGLPDTHRRSSCPDTYVEHNFFDRWVIDQTCFIDQVLRHLPTQPRQVIVLGASEGGVVAPVLAKNDARVTHLVALAAGGMKMRDWLEIKVQKLQIGVEVDELVELVMRDPFNHQRRIFGQTYKWWSSMLTVDPLHYFNALEIPILIAFGQADEHVPVECGYYLRDQFARSRKRNLTLRVYARAGHGLNVGARSIKAQFFDEMIAWLQTSTQAPQTAQHSTALAGLPRTAALNDERGS